MNTFSKISTSLLLVLSVIASSCNTNTTATPAPTGNFTGQFVKIHLNTSTGKLDTSKCNLNLSLSATTGFKVTGDTSTLHAGSYGSYIVSGSLIQFADQTATVANIAKSPKVHLNGTLQYAYDGTNLQMFSSNDTLGYNYIFKVN